MLLASFTDDLRNWLPGATILFMIAMVTLLALVMRTLPRTKPQEIKPDSASSVRWDDIAGVEDARAELQEVVEFLRAPEKFARVPARACRSGVLLHGPPGTGKTLLAKAVAHESGARFYAQSAAGFVEMFAGLGSGPRAAPVPASRAPARAVDHLHRRASTMRSAVSAGSG